MAPPSNGSIARRARRPVPGAGDGSPEAAGGVVSRIFPHSLEAEEGLLACCILNPDTINRCLEAHFIPETFYQPSHQLVFEALIKIHQEQSAVDEIILAEELKKKGCLEELGGYPFINQITNRIETTAHAAHFLGIVREKYLLRRLILAATSSIERCYSHQGDLDQLLEAVEQEVFAISQERSGETARHLRESVREAYTLIQKLLERRGEFSGVASGFHDLDKLTYGFHPSEMIVLAARPSMGKTSLALNFAEAAILPKPGNNQSPVPILFFSLEMSSEQLALRLLCGRARVSMIRLREGISNSEEKKRLVEAADELTKAPLWIDDSGSLNIMEVRAKARRLHSKHNLGLIVIDYLQLLSGTDSNVQREQQIAEISRGLKAMAKELGLPVIVLSQLNRESERERRQPRLSDLRESGSIEQDADVVLILARPRDAGDEHSVALDRADLIIAKQRNGPVGNVHLTFLREITRFESFAGQVND